MNLNDIKSFINQLDNNNFNKQDLREVINYLSLIDNNYNLVNNNNNYVQIKREKFFLKLPELPILKEKEVNNNANTNNIKVNNNLKKEKNIVIDQKFILK